MVNPVKQSPRAARSPHSRPQTPPCTHPHRAAQKLRKLRQTYRLTQQDLADRCGVERIQVTRWETGVQRPTRSKMAELEQAGVCNFGDWYLPATNVAKQEAKA